MQTSFARRHRRMGGAREAARPGPSPSPSPSCRLHGTVGIVGRRGGRVQPLQRGLAHPEPLHASAAQQTKVFDRSGDVELARLGDFKREVVAFEDLPPEVVDATTAIEDKSFWENAGFDPIGIGSAAGELFSPAAGLV
jgi:membrane peptidoglycan carboxypeptidase